MDVLFVVLYIAIIGTIVAIYISFHSDGRHKRKDKLQKFQTPPTKAEPSETADTSRSLNNTLAATRNLMIKTFSDSGWSVWDESIHSAAGQTDRFARAANNISVIAYDSKLRIAKIRGSTGNIYLTTGTGCSCMDFQTRHLPCKHMYKLAISLSDNSGNDIYDDNDELGALYGLKIALAGKFPGGRNSPDGIRAQINALDGQWTDEVTLDTSILLCGESPSQNKLQRAKNGNVTILSKDELFSAFTRR